MNTFRLVAPRELRIEPGTFRRLVELVQSEGYHQPILITGGRSVRGREEWGIVTDSFLARGLPFLEFTVRGEPGPDLVNDTVREIVTDAPQSDVVVAVGGGSAIDAAKAVAAGVATVTSAGSAAAGGAAARTFDITHYLEGVGTVGPSGDTLPVIAFPTTAGTGTEATMNAVISRVGPGGFKKSLRHPGFVPRMAVIDTDLHENCPVEVTRASGLDAITQLLEPYLSTKANPVTDALAILGLSRAGKAFPRLLAGDDEPELRSEMALAAYLSGVCLSNAGLGVIHGFASPLGALRDIPHGVVCGMLLAPVLRRTLDGTYIAPRGDAGERLDDISRALGAGGSAEALVDLVADWAAPLGRLGDYGFTREDLREVVAGTGLKNYPVAIDPEELNEILGEVL